MFTFHLKDCWFQEIQNGNKRTEYRAVKPYWEKRLKNLHECSIVRFKSGYGKGRPEVEANIIGIDVGPCPYPGWNGDYFRIRFALRSDYPEYMDPSTYYPGFGVDDMNLCDYYDWRRKREQSEDYLANRTQEDEEDDLNDD